MSLYFKFSIHMRQIKKGGLIVFFYKSGTLVKRMLSSIWAIPSVLAIRLIRPIIFIRFGTIRSDRIGHFVSEFGLQFAENSINNSTVDWYWLPKLTSNRQWEIMIRRNVYVSFLVRYLDYWNMVLPGGKMHSRPSTITDGRDITGAIHRSNSPIKFLHQEEKQVKSWLRSYGWKDGDQFVCVLVRDAAFLSSSSMHKNTHDYNYHSYRDDDIANYIDALEWLANNGVWVIRMGRIMNNRLLTSHEKIIDYAFSPDQSDLLDIWLFANCDLCISTGSGPDMVSLIYQRPILFINYIPFKSVILSGYTINHPRKLVWTKTGLLLTLKEHLEHAYGTTQEYKDANIDVINLNSGEILSAVKEAWRKLEDDNLVALEEDLKNQNKFIEIIMQHESFNSIHGFIHPKACISTIFLKNHPSFLQL